MNKGVDDVAELECEVDATSDVDIDGVKLNLEKSVGDSVHVGFVEFVCGVEVDPEVFCTIDDDVDDTGVGIVLVFFDV